MKAFTDLEQSKKLAKILPLESADMYWWFSGKRYYIEAMDDGDFNEKEGHIRAWSLATLLDVLPYPEIWQDHSTNRWACSSLIKDTEYLWESENPVDSCVEVIIKLHKEGLL